MDDQQSQIEDTDPGLIAGIVGIAKNGFGLLVNRVELAALELAEVRGNLFRIVLVGALGAIAAWFAIAFWSVLIVALSWPALGWKILLILAVVFTLMAIAVFLYARSTLRQGKLSMPATMAELRSDRDSLVQPKQSRPGK